MSKEKGTRVVIVGGARTSRPTSRLTYINIDSSERAWL